jgi:hypothetical protein
MSALLGFTSERRWLRYADKELAGMFPRTIGQSGWNKRVRKAFFLFIRVIRMLAMDTSLWSDDVWVVDSTPVQCGCSRETVKRSDAAGWAEYGYCASHSRYFWGLRLHLVCTLTGLPVMFALAGAKADERETLLGMLEAARDVTLFCRRQGLPDCRGAGIPVCRACCTGPVALGSEAGRGSRRRDEREPRPGRPDAAGAQGWVPRMAGMSAGCMETSGDPGTDGRQPGIIQLGRPWNVAVEQSCAVPVAGGHEGAAARRIPIPPSR